MRSLQHLDAVEIEEHIVAHARPAMVNVVDEGANRLIEGLLIARSDAPDVHIARCGTVRDVHRRHGLAHVDQRIEILFGELGAPDDLRRNRNALKIFRSPLCADHDLGQLGVVAGGVGVGGAGGRRADRSGSRGEDAAGGGAEGDRAIRKEEATHARTPRMV